MLKFREDVAFMSDAHYHEVSKGDHMRIVLFLADEMIKCYVGRYYFLQIVFIHMYHIF